MPQDLWINIVEPDLILSRWLYIGRAWPYLSRLVDVGGLCLDVPQGRWLVLIVGFPDSLQFSWLPGLLCWQVLVRSINILNIYDVLTQELWRHLLISVYFVDHRWILCTPWPSSFVLRLPVQGELRAILVYIEWVLWEELLVGVDTAPESVEGRGSLGDAVDLFRIQAGEGLLGLTVCGRRLAC